MLSWQVGDVRITQIVELTTASLGPYLLPQATPEVLETIDWLTPFVDAQNQIVLSIHALVLETPDQCLVVDTCIGNDKPRSYPRWNYMQGRFLDDFVAAGFALDQIDTVLCTHMHVDHVGWNTRLVDGKWQPTFANARYLFAEIEWRHWQREPQEYGPVIEDSVQPIFDAGLATLVGEQHKVSREIQLEPTPGHTPGHVSIHITSRGEEGWSSTADVDQFKSASTRARFLERYADRPVLIIGTHFAAPTAGHIVRDGDTFRLDY
jgi:glyoxylase-like metal-dependent hydrolase (beta-lactamase superfamily II)